MSWVTGETVNMLSALSGVVVGFILKSAYDFFIYSKDRQDKYFFALLTKRFEVYQEANSICEQLKSVMHGDNSDIIKVTAEARGWFHRNNLYLEPSLRSDFNSLIMDVAFYDGQLNDLRLTSQYQGNKHPETKKKETDLKDTWNRIMCGTQEKIQRDLDKYFDKLE